MSTTYSAAYLADILARPDVRVSRIGWVTHKASDSVIGIVSTGTNAAGAPIWRAQSGDVGGFSFTRNGAIETVLDLHNMQEKARAYDRLTRLYKATS